MNTPDNKRRRDSQERMEKAYLQLVQKKNPDDITVSRVCEVAGVNRTTFYANYEGVEDLKAAVKRRMLTEYTGLFADVERGNTPENFLRMFTDIKENQIFYRTYFKLGFDVGTTFDGWYDREEAQRRFGGTDIEYHGAFFKAGITALIKLWLSRGCEETPEQMLAILKSEYGR